MPEPASFRPTVLLTELQSNARTQLQPSMSGQSARTLGRLLAERAKAAGAAYGGGGGGGGGRPGGAGGAPPNLGKIIGGSGAAIALVVGGLVINSALFNGGCCVFGAGAGAGAAVDGSSFARVLGCADASEALDSTRRAAWQVTVRTVLTMMRNRPCVLVRSRWRSPSHQVLEDLRCQEGG